MSQEEEVAKLHPLAEQVLKAVVVPEKGEKAAIPPPALAKLKVTLKAHREDRTAFEHLAVLFVRLRDGKLLIAAEQMRELAAIGLTANEVEKAIERADQMRGATKLLEHKTQQATGAAFTKTGPIGVGLRPKKR